ncbi:hypothetical protein ABIA33_000238 [Streptacidiphilus sp. MAP12-16]|uniref:hypothetical protein n=1 Tax=Streptacidiphilus sp. MAP12-16 TaxID=3156300 RepID=UPI003514785A
MRHQNEEAERSMQLRMGDTLLGSIIVEERDMPWWLGRFEAAPEFDSVRPLFDDWSRAVKAADDGAMDAAFNALRDLGLVIDRADGAPISRFFLYIDADRVRLRY